MPAAELSIRAMEADELDPLFELYKEVVADGGAMPADGEPTIDVFLEGWIRKRSVFVAWRDGEAVGTYSFDRTSRRSPHTSPKRATSPARRARRGGIGTELLRHSLDKARELGFSAVMFNPVLESNPLGSSTRMSALRWSVEFPRRARRSRA